MENVMTPQFLPNYLPTLLPDYIPPTEGHSPTQMLYGSVRIDITDWQAIRDTDILHYNAGPQNMINMGLNSFTPSYEYAVEQANVFNNITAAACIVYDLFGMGAGVLTPDVAIAYYNGQSCFYLLSKTGQPGKIIDGGFSSAGATSTPFEMMSVTGALNYDGMPLPTAYDPETFVGFTTVDLIWSNGWFLPIDNTYTIPYVPVGTTLSSELILDAISDPLYTLIEGIANPVWNQEFVSS